MSIARLRTLGLTRRPLSVSSRRNVSSNHGEEHAQFPKEDFATPFWRNALIVAVLAIAAYEYAPEPGDDTYLTRWIALYKTPAQKWLDMNAKHTALQEVEAENTRLTMSARLPPIHRYRYPQLLDQASPFLVGVGKSVDMKDAVIRQD